MMTKAAIDAVGAHPAKVRDWFAKVHGWKGVTRVYSTDANNDMAHSLCVVKFTPGTTSLEYVKTVTSQPA